MVSPNRLLHPLLSAVTTDACAFAVILLAFGFTFYLHWNFWEDQSAQAYMTWGMFHGMRPYVDLVDPNWPGILIPHTLAYLLAGTDAWGLRSLDLLFAYALLMATSLVLASWGTPMPMRIVAGCAYLTNYFATGWMWTAQRESFCWPLFVISVVPFLLMLGPRMQSAPVRNHWHSFWFGIVAGFSLWIKPSPWPAMVAVYATAALLCDRENRSTVVRGIVWHTLGVIAITLLFIASLAYLGELRGFIKWGIFYDLGPYAQVKFSWPARFRWSWEFLSDPKMRQVAIPLGVAGSIAAFSWPRHSPRWLHPARPIIVSLVLVIAGALTVLLQGKPSSLYHFIPLEWSLAMYAAVIWSIRPWWNRQTRALALAAAAFLTVLTIYEGPSTAGPTPGEVDGPRLESTLAPSDQVVEWGYAPSLLLATHRRTPFMTFIGTAFLVTSPSDSWATREVLDRLNIALQNPSVRYLLVEHVPNYKMRDDILPMPGDYLQADPALRKTMQTQYQPLPPEWLRGFDCYVHQAARR